MEHLEFSAFAYCHNGNQLGITLFIDSLIIAHLSFKVNNLLKIKPVLLYAEKQKNIKANCQKGEHMENIKNFV